MSWRASSGVRIWLLQRLSATYITVFFIVFIGVWAGEIITYESWRTWVAHPLVNIMLILFVFAVILHAWVGTRDIIMDYFDSTLMRYLLLIGFSLTFIGMGLWVLRTLIMVTPV